MVREPYKVMRQADTIKGNKFIYNKIVISYYWFLLYNLKVVKKSKIRLFFNGKSKTRLFFNSESKMRKKCKNVYYYSIILQYNLIFILCFLFSFKLSVTDWCILSDHWWNHLSKNPVGFNSFNCFVNKVYNINLKRSI